MSSQETSFTPEDKLELLFDPKLIPGDVKDALPNHLHVCIGHLHRDASLLMIIIPGDRFVPSH